ncbi:malate synthase G [alpha proteobacterium U9-1i]|nr:malate synthase G [alpha proteobacterium U9-1i]
MSGFVERSGLRVARVLADFIETRALPGVGIEPRAFWDGVAQVFERFTPENAALLARRDELQSRIDDWWRAHAEYDAAEYVRFLGEVGYFDPEPAPFAINPTNVDAEIALMAGPQLVAPARNARFVLNAVNARWGSLYDALYGTDVIPGPVTPGYDAMRGAAVVARARAFLDDAVPLARGSHAEVNAYTVQGGALSPALADVTAFVGYNGAPESPSAILLRHNGLHIEIRIDKHHPVGASDRAGVVDVMLEAALTTIVDLEDSIAAVDAEDKVEAYANWLGLMAGDLSATFDKGGRAITRVIADDRAFMAPDGGPLSLPGRSVLFVRNVGHLMRTPALQLPSGEDAPEGILDAIVTSLIGMHDVLGLGRLKNSRTGSIYIVKPKMHGAEEAAFSDRLFDAVEDLLGLARHTIKIGLMDEERRTSANLPACIHAVKDRIVFINTGFLDRTGDEIHTSMHAGAMVRKADMKSADWIAAYESRNVGIGLAYGFSGRAQIGKGMWAAPDRMADMVTQKIAHPNAGATTAWVPSPTAATLHAMHYHMVDVAVRQREIAAQPVPSVERLLTIPLAGPPAWTRAEIEAELSNNAQGILGYVVRWIDQGVGCSKVPDIHDVGLMEDRATLRISSQHIANWLLHGICSEADVDAALLRMAAVVDAQNSADPLYRPMASAPGASLAFLAARALILEGVSQPNGYTEPLLHAFRRRAKAR